MSATLPHDVLEMTHKFMTDPVRILVKRDELTLEVSPARLCRGPKGRLVGQWWLVCSWLSLGWWYVMVEAPGAPGEILCARLPASRAVVFRVVDRSKPGAQKRRDLVQHTMQELLSSTQQRVASRREALVMDRHQCMLAAYAVAGPCLPPVHARHCRPPTLL